MGQKERDEQKAALRAAEAKAEESRIRTAEREMAAEEQRALEAAEIAKLDEEAARRRATHDANVGKVDVGGKLVTPKPGE